MCRSICMLIKIEYIQQLKECGYVFRVTGVNMEVKIASH